MVAAGVTIRGPRAPTWAAIADIEHAPAIIRGIERIEILERPARGLLGLKWRETRMLFGKPESADKRITAVAEGESYETRAEDGGFVFLTTHTVSGDDGGVTLTGRHESRPQGLKARLTAIPMVLLFRGVIRKAILKDLEDVKAAVERGSSAPGA
jgi:hypothetical protein